MLIQMTRQLEFWKMDKVTMPDSNLICSNGDQRLHTFTCIAKFISATRTRNNARTMRWDTNHARYRAQKYKNLNFQWTSNIVIGSRKDPLSDTLAFFDSWTWSNHVMSPKRSECRSVWNIWIELTFSVSYLEHLQSSRDVKQIR